MTGCVFIALTLAGISFSLQNGRVQGALLWNVWKQVDVARRLIAEPGPFTTKNLKGRVPAKTSSPKQDS